MLLDIKNVRLIQKNRITSKRIFTISLSLTLMVFVFNMSPSSLFPILKPVSAAGLTNISILPTSNIVNARTTYDIYFQTATTGTIKTIEMTFPAGFDLTQATRYIERIGIGSGSLSSTGSILKYTVNSPESVSAGKTIRLEIAKIIATTAGSFSVSIKTLNTGGGTIDGPTNSGLFPIKSIEGTDISPAFMIRKTLNDDDAGHAQNWNPDGISRTFSIQDGDISGDPNSVFVSIMMQDPVGGTFPPVCSVRGTNTAAGFWHIICDDAPIDLSKLDYIITKLPPNVATSTASASSTTSSTPTISSPFDSIGSTE